MRTSSLLAQLTSLPRISIQFLVTREPELLSPPAALSHSAANLSCMKMSLGESQHSLVTSNYSGPRGRLRARVRLSRHLTDRPCRSRGLFFSAAGARDGPVVRLAHYYVSSPRVTFLLSARARHPRPLPMAGVTCCP